MAHSIKIREDGGHYTFAVYGNGEVVAACRSCYETAVDALKAACGIVDKCRNDYNAFTEARDSLHWPEENAEAVINAFIKEARGGDDYSMGNGYIEIEPRGLLYS